jgi:hypothetical protein
MKFRKKPVVIEAVRWDGANDREVVAFCPTARFAYPQPATPSLVIPTLEGDHLASVGDWIIRGIKGEFYPCKPDIAATYDPVAGDE